MNFLEFKLKYGEKKVSAKLQELVLCWKSGI